MEATAKKFEAVADELQGTLTNLKNKVAALQSAWAGQGATSFQGTMEEWSKDQNNINQLLHETAGLIRTAGQSYGATDANTASRFNNQGGGSVSLPL